MKTLKKIEIKPVYVEFIPENSDMVYGEIYISNKFNTSLHLCLCGCNILSVTPLNRDGWNLIENKGKITFVPSILNTICPNKSHYVINDNIAHIL